MNHLLLDRSTGALSPYAFARLHTAQLIAAVQLAPNLRFDGGERAPVVRDDELGDADGDDGDDEAGQSSSGGLKTKGEANIWAHQVGVNALAVERFENRWCISGGADASIKIWDLQKFTPADEVQVLKPKGQVARGPLTHKFGITNLSFYPFDADAFLSSSYDHNLKLYSTESLSVSASFNLSSIIYAHALSPIASHLLVACATQHPTVRLVDLRSGSAAHALAGHAAAILALSWSPTREHVLASASTDGTVRVWDVRKSAPTLGLLDLENSVGVTGYDGFGGGVRARESAKAHTAAVNGVCWTDDGAFLVTAGHDNRVRVWDAATGANTLAAFGPTLRNSHLGNVSLLVTPTSLTPPGQEILFYPNEQELLMFELHQGKLVKRLRVPGPSTAAVKSSRTGERNMRNRITALAWRGPVEGILSGHSNGLVRAWAPVMEGDEESDDEDEEKREEGTKRKRAVLDDIYRDLTRQKITFG